ncbi:MAG: MBL fold metallo-hydrolase [Chthoniobacterales bacterium]
MKKLLLLIWVTCVALARAESDPTRLTWYGHAAFKIITPNGRTILVDPWISNPLNKNAKEAPRETRQSRPNPDHAWALRPCGRCGRNREAHEGEARLHV